MRKALIEKATGRVLCLCDAEDVFSGDWADESRFEKHDAPENESVADLKFDGSKVVIDNDKKLEKQGHESLLNRLKGLKKSDIDTLEKCQDVILDLAKAVRKLVKGD